MPPPARKRATYDDVLAAPDHVVAEIVDGELYTSPRPAPRHANASTGLASSLRGPFDHGRGGPGGWRILFEPEMHLAEQIVVPAIAGWRRERLPALPDTAYFPVAPDWVCEVQSPSTAAFDRAKKLRVYAEHGVRHAWMADPTARTLEILRLEHGRWIIVGTFAGEAVIRGEPFDAIELELALLRPEPA